MSSASAAGRFIIVVGVDFSELSNRAMDQALDLACCRENAEVHAVLVEPESWIGVGLARAPAAATKPDVALQQLQQRASERVRAMGGKLDGRRLKRVVVHFRRGAAAENIAQLAADLDADLVVVGSHGHRGLERLLLGSVAERVSRLARCPVWIVRPKDHATAGRVPEIEPPCPECVKHRQETGGAGLWCARHAEHHIRPHRYSYATHGVYAASSAAYQATPEGM
ncbi:universal stress protein [Sorangium sp. So ce1335]|uniref:universal stress protein n=1 Tax=Sorangium sp. So ce1335 TaxID=3133335 RepID=UPI003F5FCABD